MNCLRVRILIEYLRFSHFDPSRTSTTLRRSYASPASKSYWKLRRLRRTGTWSIPWNQRGLTRRHLPDPVHHRRSHTRRTPRRKQWRRTRSQTVPWQEDQVELEEEQEQQQWVGHRTCTEEEFLSLRKTMNSIMFKFVLHINIISRCPWGISLAFKGSPNQHTYVTNCIPIRYLYFLYFLILINFMCR